MINKIDFDGVSPATTPKKRAASKETTQTATPDIAVSSHISNMVTTLVAENQETSEMDRVSAIKKLIESNQYKVDADALAKKLYRSLFSKNMDI